MKRNSIFFKNKLARRKKILQKFRKENSKRDLGCHARAEFNENGRDIEKEERRHPLTTFRMVLEPIGGGRIGEGACLLALGCPPPIPIRIKIEEGRWKRPLLWEFLSTRMVAMVSNRRNFSTTDKNYRLRRGSWKRGFRRILSSFGTQCAKSKGKKSWNLFFEFNSISFSFATNSIVVHWLKRNCSFF